MNLNSPLLEIKDLQVSINENEILKSLNLKLIKVKFMQLWDQMDQEKVHFQKFLLVIQLIPF
jgi:hypothetical protein